VGAVLFFVDDEASYLEWMQNHPDGFVVNTNRTPAPSYMQLHRSGCASISEYEGDATPGGFTERDYAKACADSIEELKAWVRKRGRRDGSFTSAECPLCQSLQTGEIDWEE
jgi:hypothetical protein